jgi:hypothetical protein
MKKVLLLTMCLSLCASVAMADHIGLYNEALGTNCFRVNPWNAFGNNTVYVIQKFNTGSSGAEFRVNNTANAPYTSMIPGNSGDPLDPFATIGTPEAGISVAYKTCIATPSVLIMRLVYSDPDELGLAPTPCGKMEVVPNPAASPPALQTADCQSNLHPATGGSFYWGTNCTPCADPTATSATTWGSVKALYR